MKTVKEVYGISESSSVRSDGSVIPATNGWLFPDDAEWRMGASIEYRTKGGFTSMREIRRMVFELLDELGYSTPFDVIREFDRMYPMYMGMGLVRVVEFRGKVVNTAMKLSKFLRRVAPTMPSDKIRDIADLVSLLEYPLEITLTRDPDVILSAYTKIISCMSDTDTIELPLIYLQDPYTQLAVITAKGRIVGRAWVRGTAVTDYYILGIFDEAVGKFIGERFHHDYDFLRGIKFKGTRFPYLDSCLGRVDFDGEFVTPNPRGRWTTTKTGRIISFR